MLPKFSEKCHEAKCCFSSITVRRPAEQMGVRNHSTVVDFVKIGYGIPGGQASRREPAQPRLPRVEGVQQAGPKPQNVTALKVALPAIIRNDLSDETIRKSVPSFHKRFTACVKVQDWLFKHQDDQLTKCLATSLVC